MNKCESCTFCCFLTAVPELNKPVYHWCDSCSKGEGCSVYENRPQSCKDFRCIWLSGGLSDDLRPDKCNVMFERVTQKTYLGLVSPIYPNAWKEPNVQFVIRSLNSASRSVVVCSGPGTQQTLLVPEGTKAEDIWTDLMQAAKVMGIK